MGWVDLVKKWLLSCSWVIIIHATPSLLTSGWQGSISWAVVYEVPEAGREQEGRFKRMKDEDEICFVFSVVRCLPLGYYVWLPIWTVMSTPGPERVYLTSSGWVSELSPCEISLPVWQTLCSMAQSQVIENTSVTLCCSCSFIAPWPGFLREPDPLHSGYFKGNQQESLHSFPLSFLLLFILAFTFLLPYWFLPSLGAERL